MRFWLGLGLVEIGLLIAFAWTPVAHRFPWPGLLLLGMAFAAYAAAAGLLIRGRRDDATAAPGGTDPWPGRVIWGLAVVVRLALLPLAPELSDDVNRYLWDGHVQAAGVNPYEHAPDAFEVSGLRTGYHPAINNPSVSTIYPPAAQLVFLLIALAGSSVFLMKAVWIGCDLATAWVLARTVRDRGGDEMPVLLLWLWSPLLLVEVAWSGHLESLGLLALALTIRFAGQGRVRGASAGVALAIATLTKFAPAAALPALVRRQGLPAAIGFLATVALLYLPYASAGQALFTGLRTYNEHWWFMKGAFGVLEWIAGDPINARRLAAVIVLGVIGWTAWKAMELDRALLWILGAGMIFTPTLHPWYVLWMLPMAVLRQSRPWLLLSGLAFTGYFGLGSYQDTGEWAQPLLARAVLWLPFFALMLYEAWRTRSSESHEGTS